MAPIMKDVVCAYGSREVLECLHRQLRGPSDLTKKRVMNVAIAGHESKVRWRRVISLHAMPQDQYIQKSLDV